jgi:hypothetical protein
LPDLNPVFGYADTVSVDPNLHVVAHAEGGEKQLGFLADLEILRGISQTGSQNLLGLSNLNPNHMRP